MSQSLEYVLQHRGKQVTFQHFRYLLIMTNDWTLICWTQGKI